MSTHEHECEGCGNVWAHDPDKFSHDDDNWKKEHTCAKCGKEQYTIRGVCGGLDIRKLCKIIELLGNRAKKVKPKGRFENVKNSFMDLFE